MYVCILCLCVCVCCFVRVRACCAYLKCAFWTAETDARVRTRFGCNCSSMYVCMYVYYTYTYLKCALAVFGLLRSTCLPLLKLTFVFGKRMNNLKLQGSFHFLQQKKPFNNKQRGKVGIVAFSLREREEKKRIFLSELQYQKKKT